MRTVPLERAGTFISSNDRVTVVLSHLGSLAGWLAGWWRCWQWHNRPQYLSRLAVQCALLLPDMFCQVRPLRSQSRMNWMGMCRRAHPMRWLVHVAFADCQHLFVHTLASLHNVRLSTGQTIWCDLSPRRGMSDSGQSLFLSLPAYRSRSLHGPCGTWRSTCRVCSREPTAPFRLVLSFIPSLRMVLILVSPRSR